MQVISRPLKEPSLHCGRLVSRIVVENDVDHEIARNHGIDALQELEKLCRAMAAVTFADHLAGRDVEGSEERRGPVSLVIVSAALGLPRLQRKERLRAIESLDLGLLV